MPRKRSFIGARIATIQASWLESSRAAPVTLPTLSFLDPLHRLPFEWEAARAEKAKPRLAAGRNGAPTPKLASIRDDFDDTGRRLPKVNGATYSRNKLLRAA